MVRTIIAVALCCIAGCTPPTAQQLAANKEAESRKKSETQGSSSSSVPAPVEEAKGDEYEARVIAKKSVLAVLKHPLDAEFSWDREAFYLGNRIWMVTGSVTAPNDFGASLTKRYEVQLRYEGDDNYRTLGITYDGKVVYADGQAIQEITAQNEARQQAEEKAAATAAAEEKRTMIEENIRRSTEASRKDKPLYQVRKWAFADGTIVEGALKSYGAGKIKIDVAGELKEFPSASLSPADLKFVNDNL